jgi:membrane fusion protein (multidrug efflux system)
MRIKLIPATLTLMTGALFSSCGSKEQKNAEPAAAKVSVTEVSGVSRTLELRYSGTIEPDNTAQIGFAVPGVVSNILVQEGQHVVQGQLLATIDATEYANALAIANAGLEQAEDMHKRLDGLYKKGSLPEKDYIDIKTKVAQARAQKSISAKRIQDSKLYAPMSGIISGKMIERGSTAAPGVPAFTIIKTDQVYARVSVPESEVGAMKNGMEVSVLIPTLGESFSGKIGIINPQADAISKTYSVKVKLGNPAGRLLPGMIAETKVNTGKAVNAIIVPAPAIIRDADGITYVFLASADKKAIRKRVTVGNVTGDNEVIITDGLGTGDKIVTAGQTRLKDGAAISF